MSYIKVLRHKKQKQEITFAELFPAAVSKQDKYCFSAQELASAVARPDYVYHNYPQETEAYLGIKFAPVYVMPQGKSSAETEDMVNKLAYSSYVIDGEILYLNQRWESHRRSEEREILLLMHAYHKLANNLGVVLSELRVLYHDICKLNPDLKLIPDPKNDIDKNIDFLRGVTSGFPVEDIKLFLYGSDDKLEAARVHANKGDKIEELKKSFSLPPFGNSGAFSWIISDTTWGLFKTLLTAKEKAKAKER